MLYIAIRTPSMQNDAAMLRMVRMLRRRLRTALRKISEMRATTLLSYERAGGNVPLALACHGARIRVTDQNWTIW
jgi:hypothetical protein